MEQLQRRLDAAGGTLSLVCLSHVWHVALKLPGGAAVPASDPDLVTALWKVVTRLREVADAPLAG